MTLAQIEKTRYFLSNIDKVSNLTDMEKFSSEIIGFYGKEFSFSLKVKVFNTENSYTNLLLEKDKAIIKSFLESQLANVSSITIIEEILNLLQQADNLISNPVQKEMWKFVAKIYHSYHDVINFDNAIKNMCELADGAMKSSSEYVVPNVSTLEAIKNLLKRYAIQCLKTSEGNAQNAQPPVLINNYNTANASVNVEISVIIKQARQQVEDAGLADDQYKAVMDKLNEIEEIAKIKDSKGKRWAKATKILKWVAEQGITVAGIVLPLLAPMIG